MKGFKSESDGIKKANCRWIGMLCVILLAFLLVVPNSAYSKDVKYGGVLTFGAENEFAGFELLKSAARLAINGSIAANTIMEPLFQMDENENLIPVLGMTANKSEGGKSWIIKLRRGVNFHDGTPFNADAVVDHWKRFLNPENKFRGRVSVAAIISVEKADDYTVRFNLKHEWLPFLRFISSRRNLMNLLPSPKAVEQDTQNRAPVGTGPFVFKEWRSGDRFVVAKNPDYWQKNKPYLDEIIFKPMQDNQTRFASLQTGQLDIIWMDRGNIIKKAINDSSLKVYSSEDNGAEIVILNTSKPPLDDINVRRAIAHAHSQDRQVKMVYQDSIPIVHHPFGKSWQCLDDDYLEYDPVRAKQFIVKYGMPVELEYLHSSSKRGREIGEITQRLLKDVGVKANPVGLKFGPVIKKVISGKFQASTWRISSMPDQGPSLFRSFHSKSRANFSRYKNPEMDKLLVAQRMETDPEKRKKILCQIARLINKDVPIVYRGGMRSHVIVRNNVKGISTITHGIVDLANAWLDR